MPGSIDAVGWRPLLERLLAVEEDELERDVVVARSTTVEELVQRSRHVQHHGARHGRISGGEKFKIFVVFRVVVTGDGETPRR